MLLTNQTFPAEVESVVFTPRPPVNASILNLVPDQYDYHLQEKIDKNRVIQGQDEVVFGIDPWLDRVNGVSDGDEVIGSRGIRKRRKKYRRKQGDAAYRKWRKRFHDEDNLFSNRRVNSIPLTGDNQDGNNLNMFEGMVESEKSANMILRQGGAPNLKLKKYRPPKEPTTHNEFYGSSPGSGSYSTYYYEKIPNQVKMDATGQKEDQPVSRSGLLETLGEIFSFKFWRESGQNTDEAQKRIDEGPSSEITFGLKKIVNTATIVLFGISLLGWGLSQLQENTPLTIDEVRSAKLKRQAEEVESIVGQMDEVVGLDCENESKECKDLQRLTSLPSKELCETYRRKCLKIQRNP